MRLEPCLALKDNNQVHSLYWLKKNRSKNMQMSSQKLDGNPIDELSWGVDPILLFEGFILSATEMH